jgi:hypothetical protein
MWRALQQQYEGLGSVLKYNAIQDYVHLKYENFSSLDTFIIAVREAIDKLESLQCPPHDDWLPVMFIASCANKWPTWAERQRSLLRSPDHRITLDSLIDDLTDEARSKSTPIGSNALYGNKSQGTGKGKNPSKDKKNGGRPSCPHCTMPKKTFRALMAITAYFDLDTDQLDAINAFTNSRIDEEVYVRCADGYEEEGKCWKLNRALYGLRRSPLLWFRDFSDTLTKLGLVQVPEAQCLFVSSTIIVFFYVDDICILSHPSHKAEATEFRTKLMEAYEFREIGELEWFLGIRIVRDRTQRTLWLCQDSYIDKITTSLSWERGYSDYVFDV